MSFRGSRTAISLVACALACVGGGACGSEDASSPSGPVESSDPWCLTRPALEFCADFDEGALPGVFTEKRETAGGTLDVDNALVASKPGALRAVTGVADGAGEARVLKTFQEGAKYRVFMQMRVERRPTTPNAQTEIVALDVPGYAIGIGVDGAGAWYGWQRTGDALQKFPASHPLDETRFMSVRLDVDLEAVGKGVMTVRFGSDAVVDHVPIAPPVARAAPTLSIGLSHATSPADGWSVRYDNITFQVDLVD